MHYLQFALFAVAIKVRRTKLRPALLLKALATGSAVFQIECIICSNVAKGTSAKTAAGTFIKGSDYRYGSFPN
jgi:hypothetical protein